MGRASEEAAERGAEVKVENAALAQLVKCDHCGDTLGQGIACVKCGLARLRKNQPRIRDSGTRMLSAAAVAELRRRQNKPPALPGDAVAPPAPQGKEEADMAKKAECASGCGEEVEREGMYCDGCRAIGKQTPRTRGDIPAKQTPRMRGDATATKGGKFPCRNPSGNPNCGGTCGLKGGLCLSCGIRAGKQRGESRRAGTSDEPRAANSAAGPLATVSAPAPGSWLPAPAVAAGESPGPLTMAVCDFFAECARVSERVEASLVLERRQVTVTVKFALPN